MTVLTRALLVEIATNEPFYRWDARNMSSLRALYKRGLISKTHCRTDFLVVPDSPVPIYVGVGSLLFFITPAGRAALRET